MAIDSEEKRWGMLQHAAGHSAYALVLNPDGSNADTTFQRFGLLHLYGIAAAAANSLIIQRRKRRNRTTAKLLR